MTPVNRNNVYKYFNDMQKYLGYILCKKIIKIICYRIYDVWKNKEGDRLKYAIMLAAIPKW